MAWYWWVLVVGWPVTGFLALALDIRDNPRMQENIGWAEVWPVIFGPAWLGLKLWELPGRYNQ